MALLHGNGGKPFIGSLLAVSPKNGVRVWDLKSVETQLAHRPGGPTLFTTKTTTTDQGPDALVINQTYLSPCPDHKSVCKTTETNATAGRGLVGISVRDGAVRWTTELLPSVPNDDSDASRLKDETVEIIGADPGHVVINSGNTEVVQGAAVPQSGQELRTVALEATTGKKLWTTPGVLAFGLAGDVVLAQVPVGEPGERRHGKTLLALDAKTGQELWSTRDAKLATGRWLAGAEGMAVIVYLDSDDYESGALVDPRTGTTIVDDLDTARATIGQDQSDQMLAVWTSSDGRQIGSYTVGGQAMISASELDDRIDQIVAVVDGYIWTSERSSAGGRSRALDRSGNVCSDWVDGEVATVDDHYLVTSRGDSGFDVFAVR